MFFPVSVSGPNCTHFATSVGRLNVIEVIANGFSLASETVFPVEMKRSKVCYPATADK